MKDIDYKQIYNSAVIGIYHGFPAECKIRNINPELAKIYGFESAEEFLQNDEYASSLCFNDAREHLFSLLETEGEFTGVESQITAKDGKIKWISESARAIKNDNGEIEHVIGTIKDITERKDVEVEHKSAKEDWERTFDSIDDVIIIMDKELKIRRLNKAALKEFDTFVENPEGVFCTNLYHIGESHCDKCPARTTILDQKPHKAEVEYLTLGKTFQTSTLPIFDKDKEFIGVVFIAKNITERKRLKKESQLRLQQVITADKLKSLGEMVANVAHEINNPNSYISYNITLLDKSWKIIRHVIDDYINNGIDPQEKEYYADLANEIGEMIKSINTGSTRIKEVVRDLKDYSREDNENFMKLVNVNQVVEKSCSIVGAQLRKSFNKQDVILAEQAPKIMGNFQKLEQVVINLIINATQAIENKSRSYLKIKTSFNERLNAAVLEIIDNGHGIPRDVISRLFEPFFTTRREKGGTGLGLSISYEIIKKHNGIIGVQSIENRGVNFKIFLPKEENHFIDLKPMILNIDKTNKLNELLKIAFSNDQEKSVYEHKDPDSTIDFLIDHPEVDVLFLNFDEEEKSVNLLHEIHNQFPLFEMVVYTTNNKPPDLKKLGIRFAHVLSDYQNIYEFRNILNSLNRLKV